MFTIATILVAAVAAALTIDKYAPALTMEDEGDE